MNIVWFSWKDIEHPLAGGAERISWHIMQCLAKDGHNVRLITAMYPGSKEHQTINNVEIIRTGGRFSVYIKASFLFRKHFSDGTDLIIDEMNTIPFCSGFYSNKKRILLTYQLARQIWFYQAFMPIAILGYLLEPVYLFILSKCYKLVITESDSTRQDLHRYGFPLKNIKLIRVGITIKPIKSLNKQKPLNKILVIGAVRPMKQTLNAIKAFEIARDQNPKLQLIIAGDSSSKYGTKVLSHIKQSRHSDAIEVLGKVSERAKIQLLREASIVLITAVKEGWGLTVTEANSQGTPAVAFNSDGIRDSIIDKQTGLLASAGNIEALSRSILDVTNNRKLYNALQYEAWKYSRQYTYENTYRDFLMVSGVR